MVTCSCLAVAYNQSPHPHLLFPFLKVFQPTSSAPNDTGIYVGHYAKFIDGHSPIFETAFTWMLWYVFPDGAAYTDYWNDWQTVILTNVRKLEPDWLSGVCFLDVIASSVWRIVWATRVRLNGKLMTVFLWTWKQLCFRWNIWQPNTLRT